MLFVLFASPKSADAATKEVTIKIGQHHSGGQKITASILDAIGSASPARGWQSGASQKVRISYPNGGGKVSVAARIQYGWFGQKYVFGAGWVDKYIDTIYL